MRHGSIKTWFLLSYLVLLLNLGPSLHRAHFFGLHHPAGDFADASGVNHCCCHSHGHHDSGAGEGIHAVHDCAFCKFFDQYNVVVLSFQFACLETPACALTLEVPEGAVSDPVPTAARGPPVA